MKSYPPVVAQMVEALLLKLGELSCVLPESEFPPELVEVDRLLNRLDRRLPTS